MTESNNFQFSDNSVAMSYDGVLVPLMFEPWARQLLDDYPIWHNCHILDLATGTGIVTRLLSERIGNEGSIVGVDINGEMLEIAKQRLGQNGANITFTESEAHCLNLPSNSVDVVVCQQGFQFFPDRSAAAEEIHRVLVPNGKAIISTWLPVSECHVFGVICESLIFIGENEIAGLMRIPFDFINRGELINHFQAAGFVNISVSERKMPFKIPGGIDQAIKVAYSTPIGPKLRSLPNKIQELFKKEMAVRLTNLTSDGVTMGQMVSNILEAEKVSVISS